ncbi:hypothetical protein [Paenibacillus harenae]|uniref:ABC-type glycerol-3-phosphate transport system substrate-binding protein n=1 Tax=Paenibacillus harenae TaxID=306543 RepID=A0ABT9U783_PAEHA|nr:hypothetical protein [Paenibacillus harenae]MDQ0115498.1 ABC-type glycerol-3-phosphate transport system substrate-binding protein [Paenibacillus harenae]
MPRGTTGVNPAQVSGLSITSQSTHKQLAMELLRYLTSDSHSLYSDLVSNTLEMNDRMLSAPLDKERFAIVLQETKRSVPAALYMFNDLGSQRNYMFGRPKAFNVIQSGLPVQKALTEFAELLDNDFRNFNKDPAAFDVCMGSRTYSDTCIQ